MPVSQGSRLSSNIEFFCTSEKSILRDCNQLENIAIIRNKLDLLKKLHLLCVILI